MAKDNRELNAYVHDVRPRFEEMLGQAVEIPSISMDPAYAADIRRMAQLAADYLRDAGAEAHVVETAGISDRVGRLGNESCLSHGDYL